MLLKINLNIITILQLTLLISFISADNKNDLNYLRKQFTNDLSDHNSDLKWWEYLTSDTKENKNFVPVGAESVAFDVVQTHLTDDEIPDEEELPASTTPAPVPVSRTNGGVKTKTQATSPKRPSVAPTTTQASTIDDEENEVRNEVKPVKTAPRKTVQPTKTTSSRPTQPAVKSVSPRIITTTSSPLVEDSEDEELENNVVKKPTVNQPAAPRKTVQPTKTQQPTKTIPSRPQIGGTKTRTSTAPKVAPKKVTPTTTPASKPFVDDADEEEEKVVVTTRRLAVIQPVKKPLPTSPTKQQPGSVKTKQPSSGVKTRQPSPSPRPVITSARPTVTSSRPTVTSARPAVTTSRPSTAIDEEDDAEDENLPAAKSQPTVSSRPITTTSRPTTAQPARKAPQPGTKTKPLPPRIGKKQPTKTSGTKSRQAPSKPTPARPAITPTTSRPTTIASTTEAEEDDDEPAATVRTIPIQPKKVPQPVQPTKTPSGTKTRQTPVRPATSRPVITPTTARPSVSTDSEEEIDNEVVSKKPAAALPRKVSPAPAVKTRPTTTEGPLEEDDEEKTVSNTVRPISPVRKMIPQGTKKPSKPTGGVKRPPGTKTKQTPTKVTPRVIIPTTSRPTVSVATSRPTTVASSTTEAEEDDAEDENLPAAKSQPTVAPRKPTVIIQTTTSRPLGTKTRPAPQPTKTRPTTPSKTQPRKPSAPVTTTSRPSTAIDEEDDSEDDNLPAKPQPTLAPRTTQRPTPTTARRPTVSVTTTSSIIESDEEVSEELPKRENVPKPMPRRPLGTKTPSKTAGTKTAPVQPRAPSPVSTGIKTRQPSSRPTVVTSAPRIVTTTSSSLDESDDSDDENLPSQPKAPAPAPRVSSQRPQTPTTTRKPIVVINDNDEEEEINEIPKKPVPSPMPRGVKRPINSIPPKPQVIGTKTPSGTKTARPQPQPQPRIVTTARPIITTTLKEESNDSEDENLPTTARPQRPSIQTTSRPVETTTSDDDDADNEINVAPKRPPVPQPRKVPGTKSPPSGQSGTKTRQPPTKTAPRKTVVIATTARPVPTTAQPISEDAEDEPTELPARKAVPSPVPRKVSPKIITAVTEEDDDEDSNAEAPATRRPVPAPQPRRQPIGGTKGGTKTRTVQPSTQSPLKTRVVITTTTAAPLKEESDNESEKDEEELEVTSTSRPVPQPRITTQRPRGVKTPIGSTKTRVSSSRPVLRTTTSTPLDEEGEEENLIPAKPAPAPRPVGRKVVVTKGPEQPSSVTTAGVSIVTTPTSVNVNNRRVISKTNMAVPKPVSFNRRSKTREQVETTTLEPIPVPAFEPTRRSTNPIIQSISVDNEEETENLQLPRKKSAVRNAERIYSSDLAKFSSRIRYSERQPVNSQLKFSSYSPPLIDSLVEPNEPFIEINRIK